MYFVYEVSRQQRVIAKTRDTRYVSIPLNSSLTFQQLTRKNKGSKYGWFVFAGLLIKLQINVNKVLEGQHSPRDEVNRLLKLVRMLPFAITQLYHLCLSRDSRHSLHTVLVLLLPGLLLGFSILRNLVKKIVVQFIYYLASIASELAQKFAKFVD